MEILENTLQVNEFARRTRHLKIFSRGGLVRIHLGYFFSSLLTSLKKVWKNPLFAYLARPISFIRASFVSVLPVSPQRRLIMQAILVSAGALIITSLTPGGTFTSASLSYSSDYLATYYLPGEILVTDEEGYLVKINPQTDDSNRIGLTDYAVHTVESGETMSGISEKYGVKLETVMWENNIGNANSLRIGQKLLVPPVDGVSYKVASGDSLQKISKKYNISVESIIAQNGLESEVINKGQAIFLPGAKPIVPPQLIVSGSRNPAVGRAGRSAADAYPSNAAPAIGKMFIFPTTGKITQGYRGGHYALDIADRSMPPVWAGAGGTVIKASSGTWGNGYGTYVIIDHGDGVQTLYGHMSSLNVVEGQWINQGDVIGIMGNTGRVYGATGIHTHWEVMVNGVKVNPANYY